MNKDSVLKWVQLISFALVILGGLNWLIIGLFQFDVFEFIFGGKDSVVGRIFYTLFGLGAAVLLTTVLIRAFQNKKTKQA